MAGRYTYEPGRIGEYAKDRMRFELGDTMVEGDSDTCALTDEEIIAVTQQYPGRRLWKRAKLACLESICRRFAYEPDTAQGPLKHSFGKRAELWRQDYENLKAEIMKGSAPSFGGAFGSEMPPYFYTGMMGNRGAK